MASFTLTRMAVRELWISFRLLLLLGAVLAGGIAGALLPELEIGRASCRERV